MTHVNPIRPCRLYYRLVSNDLVERLGTACHVVMSQSGLSSGKAVTIQTTRSPAEALQIVRRTLESEGYSIQKVDDASATLVTSPKELRLTTKMADCGRMLGIPYLMDKRV